MGKMEEVLRLIGEGKRFPSEIARELGMDVNEVEGIIEILKSLGYIEEVEKGPSCETCPLRRICRGKCVVPKVRVLQPTFDLNRSKR
ncbi:DNA-binding protein [Thermococcus sp.]|uniref:DNA-binding protein n=1 Tax=Thermococcus sp. TaxID=35749 RepID=UPI0026366AC7|nr:DNA-binding protein [Thermococcus sp.]